MGTDFKTKRVFNGEAFYFYDMAGRKVKANEIAEKLRSRGHKARVVKAIAGQPGYFVYYKIGG